MENFFEQPISRVKLLETSSLVLAFVGDAVHTLFVRNKIVHDQNLAVGMQHKNAIELCCAKSQANKLDIISSFLYQDEDDVVRRARNVKSKSKPKHAQAEDYSKATAYEALIGWLWLSGNHDRMFELLKY
ncbi:MAG: ribonuclease III domain-containing protein [Clostridia bacterium]